MQPYHVSHVGRASRIGDHHLKTKPLGCSVKIGRKETGRPRKRVRRRNVTHWGHRAGVHPSREDQLFHADADLEILEEDVAPSEQSLEAFSENVANGVTNVHQVAPDYSELSPDTELIWIRDSDEGDNSAWTARNLAESDEVPASLSRDGTSETEASERPTRQSMSQSAQSGSDAHQDIETAVRSVAGKLPPPLKQKHPASMPPVPGSGASGASLAVRSLTRASERADKLVDELQTVRSSIPPAHRRRLRRARVAFNIAAATMIVFAFVATLLLTAVFRDQSENRITVVPLQQKETAVFPNQVDAPTGAAPATQKLNTAQDDMAADAEIQAMVFTVDEIAAGTPGTAGRPETKAAPMPDVAAGQPLLTASQLGKAADMKDAGDYTRTGEARRAMQTAQDDQTSVKGDAPSLPELPSRESVERVMMRLSRQVEKCRSDRTGRMVVEITFAGTTGQVTDARILDNGFHGTGAAQCALKAVRFARMPRFRNDALVIKYPFDL